MTDEELQREVRDLFRYGFAATPEEAAEVEVERVLFVAEQWMYAPPDG